MCECNDYEFLFFVMIVTDNDQQAEKKMIFLGRQNLKYFWNGLYHKDFGNTWHRP